MSRYHTERERQALAHLCDAFGYPTAGNIVRGDVRHIAVMDAATIVQDPEGAGEELARHVEAGQALIWIGRTAHLSDELTPPPP